MNSRSSRKSSTRASPGGSGAATPGTAGTTPPRHVRLSSGVKALPASLARRLRADYVFVGVKKWQTVGKDGIPFTDVDTSFRNACAKEGIEDFTFHGLRHTAGSPLVMSGGPLGSGGEILGHQT